MTDRPAIRAIEGMPSRPEEHLTFRKPRASSHQAGVVEVRERAGCGGGTGSEAGEGGREGGLTEDTDTKWVFKESAIEGKLMLKEDQYSCEGGVAPAAFKVFHKVEG